MDQQRHAAHARTLGRLAIAAFAVCFAVGAVSSGCGTDPTAGDDVREAGAPSEDGATPARDAADAPDAAGALDASSDASAPDAACLDASPDADIDCAGRCGPVKDPCTGNIKACGGCDPVLGESRVCDLLSNTCIKPKTTCAELAAECGTVKDSCGNYLDCPDTSPKGCSAGQECDPDTHKCRDCQTVACKDVGVECGFAWLGCGQDAPDNYTDCGSCAPAADGSPRVCNAVLHVCEPTCVPKATALICAEAKAKRGVECGVVSNGCGGTVSCDSVSGFGCASGESCGVRGIANRCDPKSAPDECKAAGRNCGTLTSACTGLVISCGDCPVGDVCNSNGICGPPCTAKTCAADFAAFECGTFPDGCGGTLKCGACLSGVCNDATNRCCGANTCAGTYAGKCGTDLANGCGQNILDCPCASGTCTADGGATPPPAPTVATGLCCAPRSSASYTSAGQCGTKLPNGCGQNNIDAACSLGQECVNNATGAPGPAPLAGVVGSCCTRTDSCSLGAGTCGAIQNSCRPAGITYTCNKCVAPDSCVASTCCQPAPACPGAGGAGAECNTTKTPIDPGCGSNRTCSCSGGRTCWCTDHVCTAADGAGTCTGALTCSSPAYAGKCGTGLSNGVGGMLTCGCGTGKTCSTSTPGALGTCACSTPSGAPYDCTNVPGGPGTPGGDACGTFSNGCGGTLTCGCTGGLTCNTAATPNVCCAPATCPATPGVGTACGPVSNGCTTVNCSCPSGVGKENFMCTTGTCTCVPDTCRGRTGIQPDRCGGTLSCGG